jgi:hypothetical protein
MTGFASDSLSSFFLTTTPTTIKWRISSGPKMDCGRVVRICVRTYLDGQQGLAKGIGNRQLEDLVGGATFVHVLRTVLQCVHAV